MPGPAPLTDAYRTGCHLAPAAVKDAIAAFGSLLLIENKDGYQTGEYSAVFFSLACEGLLNKLDDYLWFGELRLLRGP
jgi:hypothetical protein